jgi:hypothetical protein
VGHAEVQVGDAALIAGIDGPLQRRQGRIEVVGHVLGHTQPDLEVGVFGIRRDLVAKAWDVGRVDLGDGIRATGYQEREGQEEWTGPGGRTESVSHGGLLLELWRSETLRDAVGKKYLWRP